LDAWETKVSSRCFVHLLNSLQYQAVTGAPPPDEPPSAKHYTDAGMPWFQYYAADQKALPGSAKLAGLDGVAAKKIKKGEDALTGNDPVFPLNVKALGDGGRTVREGRF
jgi:hypothetical protein